VHQGDPVPEGGQYPAGGFEGHGVPIESDDLKVVTGRQQRRTMTSPTDRGVDQDAGGHRGEESHDFLAQNGNVSKRAGHLQLLERREGRRI
jgi:hypothetical protein